MAADAGAGSPDDRHQMIGDHMSAAGSPAATRVLQAMKTIVMILLLEFDLEENGDIRAYM